MAEDRDAKPIGFPLINYPGELAEQVITGELEAVFDVSAAGVPENMTAECTNPRFVDVTIEATKTLRFEPKRQDGNPVRRTGVVYPYIFYGFE